MLLNVLDLESGYGKKKVLFGISIQIPKNAIVTVLGHNGAGKSTLLSAIYGLLPIYNGKIEFLGQNITGKPIRDNVEKGIVFVPGGHQIFGELSVIENLKMINYTQKQKGSKLDSKLYEIFQIFPRIEERKFQLGRTLSGGEQQMLAIAMGLLMEPKLLILDEPSVGLAPQLVDNIMKTIQFINKKYNVGILLVEQNVKYSIDISNCIYVMRLGRIIKQGDASDFRKNGNFLELF